MGKLLTDEQAKAFIEVANQLSNLIDDRVPDDEALGIPEPEPFPLSRGELDVLESLLAFVEKVFTNRNIVIPSGIIRYRKKISDYLYPEPKEAEVK